MTRTRTASTPDVRPQRKRLGELLTAEGVLDERQLSYALSNQLVKEGRKERLGQTVARLGFVSEQAVARALAHQLGLEFLSEDELQPEPDAIRTVAKSIAERHEILPLRREEDTLVVACSDPTDVVALDDVRLTSGCRRVRAVVVTPSVLADMIPRVYLGPSSKASKAVTTHDPDTAAAVAAAAAAAEAMDGAAVEGPIVKLTENILARSVLAGASDIHVEPRETEVVVRHRIDGVLQIVDTVENEKRGALISRLKLMAGMDIAEKRRPQDGRAEFKAAGKVVDFRVSSLPSLHGEKIVIRILHKGSQRLTMDDVGFTDRQRALVLSSVDRPQGLVLITGPTGSGKTSSLYSFLGHLTNDENNIITLEDPVEYELPGVNQVQIHERIGFTFAKALRTVLRQDPDIVMLGEIRDPETAELALQASLTGHLVFSTLHTNSASGAVVRLRDLGIPNYLVASAVTMVMAQRLARTVCDNCAIEVEPNRKTLQQLHLQPDDVLGGIFRAGQGCARCDHTGYKGRTGVFEIIPVDAAVRDLLAEDAGEAAIRRVARVAGMRSLREDGLRLAMQGVTTLEEVLRVTPADLVDDGACPVCAQQVDEDYLLCPWCGVQLRPAECVTCGRELEMGWRLCPRCGTNVPKDHEHGEDQLPAVVAALPDPKDRSAVAHLVEDAYEILPVLDDASVIEVVSRRRPEALLLHADLRFREGDVDVLERLRAMPDYRDLPVILVTEEELAENDPVRIGATAVVSKPLNRETLLVELKAAVHGERVL